MSGNDNNSTSSSHEPFTTATTVEIGSTSSNNAKRKRRPAGTPDPDAEVVSLSPKTLLESDRYVCEICNQGFQRDQNLQMHRRRHKVPWKLLKRENPVVKKRVFVCPEPTCLHHDPCHALGDLVGIKKHFRRKHSNHKQWVCDKCSKAYAVQSDYKAHLKTCGTRGHSCDCGRVFSRVESFIEHQDACPIGRLRPDSHTTMLHPTVCLSRTASSPSPSNDTTAPWTSTGLVFPGPRPTDNSNNNDNNNNKSRYDDNLVIRNEHHMTNSGNNSTHVIFSDASNNGHTPTASNGMPIPSMMMMMTTTMKKQQMSSNNHRLELQLLTMNPQQDEDAIAISDENHSTTQLQLSIGSSDHVSDYKNELSSNIANSDKKLDRHSSTTTTTTAAVAAAANNSNKNSITPSLMMLKEEASEQLKLATAEKAYAEEARKEAKRQIEMAEREFANAKRIRQQAQAELDKAQELKDHAMKQVTCTLLQITCHSCKRQFQAPSTSTITAATTAPAVTATAAHPDDEPNCQQAPTLNYNIRSSPAQATLNSAERCDDYNLKSQ